MRFGPPPFVEDVDFFVEVRDPGAGGEQEGVGGGVVACRAGGGGGVRGEDVEDLAGAAGGADDLRIVDDVGVGVLCVAPAAEEDLVFEDAGLLFHSRARLIVVSRCSESVFAFHCGCRVAGGGVAKEVAIAW